MQKYKVQPPLQVIRKMKKRSGKFALNCQIFSQDTFQKYLKNVIFSQEQPKNLLRLLTRAKFYTKITAFGQQNRLFKCTEKRCKICSLYTVEGHSFIMSNEMRWELQSHVTCRSTNIIYYLKCNMWKKKETYIGKTVGDNIVGFKSRMNQHISDSRTGVSTCKFPIHVYKCGLKQRQI